MLSVETPATPQDLCVSTRSIFYIWTWFQKDCDLSRSFVCEVPTVSVTYVSLIFFESF